MTNANVDATMRSFEGATKATQAIATEIADYSKRSFDQGTKTIENLLGARSLDKAFEVQTEYAKAAYEGYVSHATKLGELYTRPSQGDLQVVPGLCRENDTNKVIVSDRVRLQRLHSSVAFVP
jgi:hypothetical protein